MRVCEFCDSPIDYSTNRCTGCGAAQTAPASLVPPPPTRGGPPPAPNVAPSVPPPPAVHHAYQHAAPPVHVGALWIIWCFIPWLSGVGFIWVGSRSKQTGWVFEGLFYMLPFLILLGQSGGEPGDGVTGFAVLLWFVSIIRGLVIKPRYETIMRSGIG